MISNKLKINNINWKSTINDYGYSDHYNIIFNLYHTGIRDNSNLYEAWNFNTSIKNWNKYKDEFKLLYNNWSPNSLSPTKAVSYLSDRILDYMHHFIGTHSINENQSIYWSKKVEKCWRKKRNQKNKNYKYMKKNNIKWNDLPINMRNDYINYYNEFYLEFNKNKKLHQDRMNEYLINCSHSEK